MPNKFTFILISGLVLLINSRYLNAEEIRVIDDEGISHALSKPVTRVISLSPHATELLFAAGATDQIAGAVSFSDYPEQAKKIPRVGSYKKVDLELILELKPDMIIGWKGGGAFKQDAVLHKLGLPVYYSEPRSFEDVATNIRNMGKLLGTGKVADKNASEYLNRLRQLREKYKNRSVISVFYQVWDEPLMTINKDHLITQVIEFCGGRNIFADLSARAPRVNIEAVISKNPKAIVIGYNKKRNNWPDKWKQWSMMQAVKNNHVFTVNADYIVRQGPRILNGIDSVCGNLDKVRMDNSQ